MPWDQKYNVMKSRTQGDCSVKDVSKRNVASSKDLFIIGISAVSEGARKRRMTRNYVRRRRDRITGTQWNSKDVIIKSSTVPHPPHSGSYTSALLVRQDKTTSFCDPLVGTNETGGSRRWWQTFGTVLFSRFGDRWFFLYWKICTYIRFRSLQLNEYAMFNRIGEV